MKAVLRTLDGAVTQVVVQDASGSGARVTMVNGVVPIGNIVELVPEPQTLFGPGPLVRGRAFVVRVQGEDLGLLWLGHAPSGFRPGSMAPPRAAAV